MIAHDSAKRFWSKVKILGPDDCWEWQRGLDRKGYGQFSIGFKKWIASRFSYLLAHGSIPEGLSVLHTCDNPPCVNPKHLFVGTALDNCLDKVAKGRAKGGAFGDLNGSRTRPDRLRRGDNSPTAVITSEIVNEIRLTYTPKKITLHQLAIRHGISTSQVHRIIKQTSWKDFNVSELANNGGLILFEGADGSGKSTLIKLLAASLRAVGIDPVLTRFPGGTPMGLAVRKICFEDPETNTKVMAPNVFDALMLADTIQTTEKVIKPALAEGRVVISDRSVFSQAPYASERQMYDGYNKMFADLCRITPDLLFLLLGTPEHLLVRANKRSAEENLKQQGKAWNDADKQKRIQDRYLRLLADKPFTRFVDTDILTAEQLMERDIWPHVESLIKGDARRNAEPKPKAA